MGTSDAISGDEVLSPDDAARARVGGELDAKWTIDRVIGMGGMGAVFAATHRNGSRAAIKVLHPEFARNREVRERFLREARIANRVDHPARVAVIDDGVSLLGEPFLVMELLDGMTLYDLRQVRGGKIALEETLRIFDTVLDLLAKCHGVGVVHRDIKPANVFLMKSGQVRVLDFGVARMREPSSEATRAGTAMGTPSYMAPEQALGLGNLIDGRADLFSVGACVYTALSGLRLNEARTVAEQFVLAATQAASSIANVAGDLPVEVVAFVDKAIAFERERRFQDAQSMRAELLGLLAQERAGHLHARPTARPSGVIVRGNDAIDEGAKATQEERHATLDRLTAVWKQIAVSLSDVRQYGWAHPQSTKSLQASFDMVVGALSADASSVRWDVTPGAFTCDGEPVWAPDRLPLDRVPYRLFGDGVRKMQIKRGVTEEEFRDLIAILLSDASDAIVEDDSVTALWDRRFEHIAYLAIDSFAKGDPSSDETDDAPDSERASDPGDDPHAHVDKDWDEASLEGRAMQMNFAAALREGGEAAAALAVDPLTRATLGAQLDLPEEKWRERYVDAFADAYVDADSGRYLRPLMGALGAWTQDVVALHNHAPILEMTQALGGAFGGALGGAASVAQPPGRRPTHPKAKDFERDVVTAILPKETLGPILFDLTDGRSALLPPALVAVLSHALGLVDDDSLLSLACACFDAQRSDALRGALLAYMKRWAKGRTSELAAKLPTAGPDLGVTLVSVLTEVGPSGAAAALDGAMKSPHAQVKLEALRSMPVEMADRAREELSRMLEDPSPDARLEALRLAASRSMIAAGPLLIRGIQSPGFHALPAAERREWLEVVTQLHPARGEAIAIEILTTHRMIPSDAVEETRAIAAGVLSRASSEEALTATRDASRMIWWNTPRVRDAAKLASRAIAERLHLPASAAAPSDVRGGGDDHE